MPTSYRFTGQREDTTGLYFYNARYYDPVVGRFAQADPIVPGAGNPQALNRYSYVLNNPIKYVDSNGHWAVLGLVLGGLAGAGYGYGSQVVHNLQSGNMSLRDALTTDIDKGKIARYTLLGAVAGTGLGMVADVAGMAVGSVGTAQALTAGAGVGATGAAQRGFGTLTRAADFGIRSYRTLAQDIRGTGLRAHHIIEARFADTLGMVKGQMASVAVTAEEHQVFTNLWRQAIGYAGSNNPLHTLNATREQIWAAAQDIYRNYPELLEAARKALGF